MRIALCQSRAVYIRFTLMTRYTYTIHVLLCNLHIRARILLSRGLQAHNPQDTLLTCNSCYINLKQFCRWMFHLRRSIDIQIIGRYKTKVELYFVSVHYSSRCYIYTHSISNMMNLLGRIKWCRYTYTMYLH